MCELTLLKKEGERHEDNTAKREWQIFYVVKFLADVVCNGYYK